MSCSARWTASHRQSWLSSRTRCWWPPRRCRSPPPCHGSASPWPSTRCGSASAPCCWRTRGSTCAPPATPTATPAPRRTSQQAVSAGLGLPLGTGRMRARGRGWDGATETGCAGTGERWRWWVMVKRRRQALLEDARGEGRQRGAGIEQTAQKPRGNGGRCVFMGTEGYTRGVPGELRVSPRTQ